MIPLQPGKLSRLSGGFGRYRQCICVLILLGGVLTGPLVLAQAAVVDPRSVVGMDRDATKPVPAEKTSAGDPSPSVVPPSGTATLFYQLQVLRDEVQELRGMVEGQAHQIERLAREQKEQYLDIDRRLSSGSRLTSPAGKSTVSPVPPAAVESGGAGSGSGSGTEKVAYTAAFQLIREKRFQRAIDAFNRLIVRYPNGQYTANAFYWLGELYFALPQPELEKSRQSFVQVVNLYPENAKVPDALYKLGVVYDRLGDRQKGLEYLNRVMAEFPGSPAAGLARAYKSVLNPS